MDDINGFHDDLDIDPVDDIEGTSDFIGRDEFNPERARWLNRINSRNNRTKVKIAKYHTKETVKTSRASIIKKVAILLAALKLMSDHNTQKLTKEEIKQLDKNDASSGIGGDKPSKHVKAGDTVNSIKQSVGDAVNTLFNGIV